jgi:plasmid stabilization system protein ParE
MAVVASGARFALGEAVRRWRLIVTSSCGAAFADLLYRGITEISNWKQYIIYYHATAPGLIEIVRVLHERMDPSGYSRIRDRTR